MVNSRAKEIWKDVPEYEGLYQASNLGRIKSLPRTTTKGGVLKEYINKRNGYCYVSLTKNNKATTHRVHKLVYSAFLGEMVTTKYDVNRQVNHIDGKKTNNSINNLEICTQSENVRHAFKNGLIRIVGIKTICLDNEEVFATLSDASRSVGGNKGELVARVCRGKRSHYRGHRFAFYDDYINNTIPKFTGRNEKGASKTLWR